MRELYLTAHSTSDHLCFFGRHTLKQKRRLRSAVARLRLIVIPSPQCRNKEVGRQTRIGIRAAWFASSVALCLRNYRNANLRLERARFGLTVTAEGLSDYRPV